MLTYQLQPRVLRKKGEGALATLPADVEVHLSLGPPGLFGIGSGVPTKLLVWETNENVPVKMTYNALTGRSQFETTGDTEPLSGTAEFPQRVISLRGNEVVVSARCESAEEVLAVVNEAHYLMPALLNVFFLDVPVISDSFVKIAGSTFRWELVRSGGPAFLKMSRARVWQVTEDAFGAFEQVRKRGDLRHIAAALYLHVACRLREAGSSEWEFMPEHVLNLCKVLQVLFGESRDKVRAGLASLGYTSDEIEGDFIPLMLLRDGFDVAHVLMAQAEPEDLVVLYRFLEHAAGRFRGLVRRAVEHSALDGGTWSSPASTAFDREQQKKWKDIIESIFSRLPTR